MKTMLDYIKKEQSVTESLLEKNLFDEMLVPLKELNIKSVVIYATGSSANAAYSAYLLMQEVLGVPVYIKEPSLAMNYDPLPDEHTLILAISQGGHSYATIEMVRQLLDAGRPVYVVTSNLESPIAQTGAHLIDLAMGIEEMPYVTLGYTVTILVLWRFALELAEVRQIVPREKRKEYDQQIRQVIQKTNRIIEQTNTWFDTVKKELSQKTHFVFIGYGSCYGVAREAETKITETCHVPTHGHELEEYMHGPYLGLHEKDGLFLLDANGKLSQRMEKLRQFLDQHIEMTYMISAGQSSRSSDLSLNLDIPENLSSIVMTVPVHLMSYYLSQMKGFNLHESFYPEFDKITGSKV